MLLSNSYKTKKRDLVYFEIGEVSFFTATFNRNQEDCPGIEPKAVRDRIENENMGNDPIVS